ncbi:hypothetical protein K490DRAFT_45755 [Saccharata proteae CBS 121410]|uniref:Glucose receptor Git3-like N-terminal domain-containing protein n=1 Tax=Saccharata proteae CBS 121410 TaxID=1314787 RepID=A0A9P4LTS7_9PEZI|nr:hypothetical protein K490DRAFT_45755 [Saccharata proteae CBS 121410]
MGYDAAVSIPTLTGSLMSCIATFCVLASYLAYSQQNLSFRHALIFNLALSDFLNSLNNSVSGIYVVTTRGAVPPGSACTFNGWFGQITVQATDFSILAIAIATLLTVTRKSYLPDVSLWKKVAICGSVWVVPSITSSTAAGLHELKSVSGNWCWISKDRTDLRYALGHGWRFTIILSTICIYAYIHYYLRQHFETLEKMRSNSATPVPLGNSSGHSRIRSRKESIDPERQDHGAVLMNEYQVTPPLAKRASQFVEDFETPDAELEDIFTRDFAPSPPHLRQYSNASGATGSDSDYIVVQPLRHVDSKTALETARRNSAVEREIQRMLLLNAYPVMYVILWIPGILNRILEAATGDSYEWLSVLQASTQYVGFANAMTYGFNEHLRGRIIRDVDGWRNRRWWAWCV